MAESFVFDNYSSLSKVMRIDNADAWPPVLASTVGPWFAQVLAPLLVSSEGRLMMRACATTLQVSEPSVADPGDVIQFAKSAMSSEIRNSLTRIAEARMRRKVFMNKMLKKKKKKKWRCRKSEAQRRWWHKGEPLVSPLEGAMVKEVRDGNILCRPSTSLGLRMQTRAVRGKQKSAPNFLRRNVPIFSGDQRCYKTQGKQTKHTNWTRDEL
eukprot:1134506-Amphidinium_carterae.1